MCCCMCPRKHFGFGVAGWCSCCALQRLGVVGGPACMPSTLQQAALLHCSCMRSPGSGLAAASINAGLYGRTLQLDEVCGCARVAA